MLNDVKVTSVRFLKGKVLAIRISQEKKFEPYFRVPIKYPINLQDKNLQEKNFEKIKPYGDTDVTLQLKAHDQNLQVCLKWETKSCLSNCLVIKTKKTI